MGPLPVRTTQVSFKCSFCFSFVHVHDEFESLHVMSLSRTPQEAITDTTEIAVSPKSLQSELTCPICLDMLTSTMTTKECLHRWLLSTLTQFHLLRCSRFCAECIITALRSGNKECPTCRKKLVSKRSLRPDPNFDMLVSKIFPDREEYEEQQEKVLAILSKNHSQQLMSTIGEAIKAQAAHVKMINRKKNLSDYDELMASHCQVGSDPHEPREGEEDVLPYRPKKKRKTGDAGAGEAAGGLQAGEVEIIFKTHACLAPDLAARLGEAGTRFIKTKVEASIDHLSQYLVLRIGSDLGLVPDNMHGDEDATPDKEVVGLKIYVYQVHMNKISLLHKKRRNLKASYFASSDSWARNGADRVDWSRNPGDGS